MPKNSSPQDSAPATVPGMTIRGSELTAEETAAVFTVVGAAAAAQTPEEDRELVRDRRFSRRRRLSTWNREEASHWRTLAGED